MESETFEKLNVSLRLERVSKSYTWSNNVVQAVYNINLDVFPGDFSIIMGSSGSGKSTLLSLIASLEKPTSGKIMLAGNYFNDLTEAQRCDLRTRTIGIVFQFFNLHPHLTARQNIELPMILGGTPKEFRKQKASELLNLVGLSNRSKHHPHELSGGELQRIGIARALANDPPLLLADEPTGHLDTETGHNIISLFSDLNQNFSKTIIMVSHDEEVLQPGMRVLKMEDGRIITG